MDALSDVLRAVRLTGAVFFDVQASEPWVAETPPGRSIVGTIFPGAEHLISYHVITGGACWGGLVGEPPVQLSAGDIIVFPHGDAHVMSSAPGMREHAGPGALSPPGDGQLPFSISMGDSAADPAHIVCGFLGVRRAAVQSAAGRAAAGHPRQRSRRRGDRRVRAVRDGRVEGAATGGECVLGRLSELMFVDVVRRYLESLPADRTDWLAALREPFVGRALAALHRSPARDWTLESLAREVGLSRSALAERFTQFVGQPPMQYLTNWRMQLAANHLLSGTDSVADDRRTGRLRVRSGVQPGVQEGGGHAAEPVAQGPRRGCLNP